MGRSLEPGDPLRIGPYRLVGVLGSGGMGRVFLGRSAGGRPVAVKVIRADLAADPEFRLRFRREVASARRVNGLYTALVVDADVDGPVPWLATAYVPGPSLADAVAGHGPLPPASLLVLAAGLAEGVAAIHAAGLVHRDLKPSNVLLADDGPRVIDFGISRAAETTALTRAGLVIGSPGFMSPEQADGGEVGPASDVFSLGAVLTFAATGHGPFGTGSTAALIYRIVHNPPRLDDVPSGIRVLAERCLAKDPGLRPTAAEILAELGEAEPAAGWLPETIAQALPQNASAVPADTAGPVPAVRPARSAQVPEKDAPGSAPDAGPALASAHLNASRTPETGLTQTSARPTVTVAGAALSAASLAGQPQRGRRFGWKIWLGAAAAVVVLATAVPLALTALPASPGSGNAAGTVSPAVVGVYSGSQYGFQKPTAIAVGAGHVWVANFYGDSVTEMDADTGAWIRTLSGGRYGFSGPRAITGDGTHLWVANISGNSVTELNASTGAFVRELPDVRNDFDRPIDIITDGARLWVANNGGSVTELAASDGRLIRTISGGSYRFAGPGALATDGQHIWVANQGNGLSDGWVTELNAGDGSLVRVISGSAYGFSVPLGIMVSGTHVWVTNDQGNSMTELDVSNGALVRILSGRKYGFRGPSGVASDGTHIWTVNSGADSVTELDAETGAWVRTLSLSGASHQFNAPFSITVDGTRAWIANGNFGTRDYVFPNGSVTELKIG